MKILQISHSFKPLWESGGMARSVYELSRSLVENGHEVCVYTTNRTRNNELKDYGYNYELNKPVNIDGIKVYYFEDLRKFLPKSFPPLPIPYRLPLVARKELKNFDIIHIHGHRSFLEISASYYARKNGIPYVLQGHGSILPSFQKDNENLRKIHDFLIGKEILNNASGVIALTTTEKEYYKQMGVSNSKIEIIPNVINFSDYKVLPEKGIFRKKYNLENVKIVLFLGRLVELKGVDLLIDAFNDLKNLKNIKLVIVGPDGGILEDLMKQVQKLKIEDKVIFTGPLFEEEKKQAYVDADVYVLPSSYETFPNTVLEASACGTSFIVTDRCGIVDLIKKYELGYVIEFDKKQLKNAIISALEDEYSEFINNERREIFRSLFDQKEATKKYEKLYKQLSGELK